MTAATAAPSELFPERYALEITDESGEGVLVDLETGSFFQLNASAAAICQVLCETRDAAEAVGSLASKLAVSTEVAAGLVASIRDGLAHPEPRESSREQFVYRSEGDGVYALDEGDRRVFTIDSRARTLRAFGSFRDEATLAEYVRAVVPKLLALLEKDILHASACRMDDRFVAICGRSGAGKTTTAKAFEAAGATLVSEDLLILASDEPRAAVYVEGEKAARAWCRGAAQQFRSSPAGDVPYESLGEVVAGRTLPLTALWFVDENRRVGQELVLRPVSKTRAATLLLGNGFLATAEAVGWRRFLVRSVGIARRLPVFEATTPAGVELLGVAARAYALNSAS